MKSLEEQYFEWCEHFPVTMGGREIARATYFAGAAAMAEQFAQGQGTVLSLIRDLAEIQTRNAQLLAEELRKLRNVQAETSGLSHWVDD